MSTRFRNEQKYLVSKPNIEILKLRLEGMLEKDKHLGDRDAYLIRSVYFDDPYDTCLHEKQDGVEDRKKWRIRTYNCDDSFIHLECKRKFRGMTQKEGLKITRQEADAAIFGGIEISKERGKLWNEFAMQILTKGYRPVTIVQYLRTPYIWGPSNVRITLDQDLSSSELFEKFYDYDLPIRSISPKGISLLEVKFDELLPDYMRYMLNLENMRNTSFSKYELCRRMPI
ncbi:MAG: polyphosphate polymerase domain-containing protein [Butyrivibrio sp.]|nr:polyphosphate polymerase domain-containing protein [Butyrivibrio sp.]